MAPQPLPKKTAVSFSFMPDEMLKLPLLAARVAAISMHWNEIETRLATFLTALTGDEAKLIIPVFLAINSDGGRTAMLRTIAKMRLSDQEYQTFIELHREIRQRYDERSKAVHGAWGISPQYPDALLFYDPRESTAALPDIIFSQSKNVRDSRLRSLKEKIRIYKERDLEDILTRMRMTHDRLNAFVRPWVEPMFEKAKG